MKQKHLTQFLVGLATVVALNWVSAQYFFRLDLTQDRRYTISPATIRTLENLPDEVFIKVYLGGEFPPTAAGFKRLQLATREMLDQFRGYAGTRLQYRFVDPAALTDAKARTSLQRELVNKGLQPTNLFAKSGSQVTESLVFPGALVLYKGKELPVLLLKGNQAAGSGEMLNQAVEGVEFELASAIQTLTRPTKKRIGILQGYSRLPPVRLADLTLALQRHYDVFAVDLPKSPTLQGLDAVVLVKPDTALREEDKYKLDQYVVNGGRALFFLDALRLDSIPAAGTLAFAYTLNLDDLLFRYGVRLNPNYVKDLSCAKIPLNVGTLGDQPQIQLVPWTYYPVINSFGSHPLVRNTDALYTRFTGTLDTVRARGIAKTPLLFTSQYTRVVNAPVEVSYNEARRNPDPAQYRGGVHPVAYLLEGSFESVYKNRILATDPLAKSFRQRNLPGKVIVCADGDLVVNDVDYRKKQPLPMGFDRFEKKRYGNQDFLLRAVDYLADDQGLILARNREVTLRPLDKQRLKDERTAWQALNLGGPLLVLGLFGAALAYRRRRRYAR